MLDTLLEIAHSAAGSIHRAFRKTPTLTLPLMAVLEELDIEPFALSKVVAYKANVLEELMEKETAIFKMAGYSDVTSVDQHFYPLQSILPNSWLGDLTQLRFRYFNRLAKVGDVFPPFPICFALRWVREAVSDANKSGFDLRFNIAYAATPEFIPEFVREKMDRIVAETSPRTVLRSMSGTLIADLTTMVEQREPVVFETDTLTGLKQAYDPFLIVKRGEEEYYIEVWGDDDHKFQR